MFIYFFHEIKLYKFDFMTKQMIFEMFNLKKLKIKSLLKERKPKILLYSHSGQPTQLGKNTLENY